MDRELIEIIYSDFCVEDRDLVIRELSSITLQDVMAESEINLKNTRQAILKLSKGSIKKVSHYVDCAKKDFRDVIYWATEI